MRKTKWQSDFSVEDFGPGIEKQYVNKVFEKFFQCLARLQAQGWAWPFPRNSSKHKEVLLLSKARLEKEVFFLFSFP